MQEAGRELYWQISSPLEGILDVKSLLYVIFAIALVFFFFGMYRIIKVWRMGRLEAKLDELPRRIGTAFWGLLSHRRILRDKFPGIMHLLIFWGFLAMTIGTAMIAFQDDVLAKYGIEILRGNFYLLFSVVLDLAGLAVIIGVLMAMYRRYIEKLERLENKSDDNISLILILVIVVTGFIIEGLRIAGTNDPWAVWSPVAYIVSMAFSGMAAETIAIMVNFLWWFHLILAMAFIAYIPYSKLMHLVTSPLNTLLYSTRAKGELAAANIDTSEMLGAGGFNKLGRKQILDALACTRCGRCLEYCPSYVSHNPLIPRQMILDLKNGLLGGTGKGGNQVAEAIGRDAIWSCTTCGACQEHCPVNIQHIDKIVEARRFLLESEGASPSLSKALEGMASFGNPENIPASEKQAFLDRLNVPVLCAASDPEVVLWLGCAVISDLMAQDTALALVKILKAAGVNAAILGSAEKCCGDIARRTGEEGLFQELTRDNIEKMQQLGVKKLLVTCPHCYNTLKNEYPRFGGDFEVVHHSEYLLDLVRTNRIELGRPSDQPLTYHDPCYLGRHNDRYDDPRELLGLTTTGGLIEMPHSRDKAICCGGGGGQMNLESQAGERVNRIRFSEAEELQVTVMATGCPFCKTMMDDASRYKEDGPKVRVKDIAELVCDAMSV